MGELKRNVATSPIDVFFNSFHVFLLNLGIIIVGITGCARRGWVKRQVLLKDVEEKKKLAKESVFILAIATGRIALKGSG